jgi:hypothetical protein
MRKSFALFVAVRAFEIQAKLAANRVRCRLKRTTFTHTLK